MCSAKFAIGPYKRLATSTWLNVPSCLAHPLGATHAKFKRGIGTSGQFPTAPWICFGLQQVVITPKLCRVPSRQLVYIHTKIVEIPEGGSVHRRKCLFLYNDSFVFIKNLHLILACLDSFSLIYVSHEMHADCEHAHVN